MIKHAFGIVAVIALVLFCTFFPFLPGRYDPLAVPLSAMAQAGALLGLVVVPFGLLWILADRSERLGKWRRVFAGLALIATSLVWIGVFFAGLTQSGYTLGIVVLILWFVAYYVVYFWFRRKGSTTQSRSAIPFYLVIVPLVVVPVQFAFLERAVEFSRNRAIQNSAPLIGAIEDYRVANGRYPTSLHAVWPDFLTYVVGIERYHYEPHGEAYNLFFEQFSYRFGTQEYVMYNPRDEHVMTSHAMDLLELTPEQLVVERTRGHYARNDAPQPHWKYFWFD
jgi:hypothetical protein